jgi:exodeoxyribonuclease V alpha subunit
MMSPTFSGGVCRCVRREEGLGAELAMQHFMLLQRNLIYTGITRGKRLLVLVGQRKALGIAVRNDRTQRRYSGLLASLKA